MSNDITNYPVHVPLGTDESALLWEIEAAEGKGVTIGYETNKGSLKRRRCLDRLDAIGLVKCVWSGDWASRWVLSVEGFHLCKKARMAAKAGQKPTTVLAETIP